MAVDDDVAEIRHDVMEGVEGSFAAGAPALGAASVASGSGAGSGGLIHLPGGRMTATSSLVWREKRLAERKRKLQEIAEESDSDIDEERVRNLRVNIAKAEDERDKLDNSIQFMKEQLAVLLEK